MALLDNFIVPLIKVLFLTGIIGGISFILIRYFYIRWSRRWKFFVTYKIMRKPYSQSDLQWIIKAMDMGMDVHDVKKKMLLSNQTPERTYEMIWIYRQIEIQDNKQKGGEKNGREFKRLSSKTQSTTTELPNIK
jgi:hypothetical protein